jgi:glycosyltransferase 2 family protein
VPRRGDAKLWVGVGISLFFLLLLFRKVDLRQLAEAFRGLDWRLVAAAAGLHFVSLFFRAVRWQYLLLPMRRIGLGTLYSATLIGYMANNVLPARLGEFVRAYALAAREKLETSAVFATLVVDRLCDGFTVLLILLVTFFTVKLPPGMERVQDGLVAGGYITLCLYLGVMGFLWLLRTRTTRTIELIGKVLKPLPAIVAEKTIPLLGSFIQGLRISSNPRELFGLVWSSLVIWAFAIWPVDLQLRAFGLHLPISASMLILVFLVFAVMVPASPGYIGTYHFACVQGLTAFGVPREKALSMALVIHAVSFFPVIAAGIYCLWKDNLSLRALRETGAGTEPD